MKGICFIEPLHNKTVQKIKTQTRRIIVSRTGFFNVTSKNGVVTGVWQCDADGWSGEDLIPVNPRYQTGDILYLKEPYHEFDDGAYLYKYGKEEWLTDDESRRVKESITELKGWKNKLFMPESAARHFIKITDVRCEKLQEVSNSDCLKEGVFKHISHARIYWKNGFDGLMYNTQRHAYKALIDKISKDAWDDNPYVWVYSYKLVNRKGVRL